MDRFKKVYSQGTLNVVEIWVDTETGVNYLFHREGNAAGLTPLLDKDGKPVVTGWLRRRIPPPVSLLLAASGSLQTASPPSAGSCRPFPGLIWQVRRVMSDYPAFSLFYFVL